MNQQLKLSFETEDGALLIRTLSNGIKDYAFEKKGQGPIEPFAVSLRNENNDIKGGCNGVLYYGCLYIDQLWIDKNYRGKKFGTQLMQTAENLGRERGCLFSTVNTMDWEALDFYKKCGYFVEFERKGYHGNSTFYFLRKNLDQD
ncbi:MAG: GNAT family N-acetyltransferase [Alphaproteobacteria bacterium]|nr:GNAT family N-acetyltransferase [Alphaproteobacteria bacterium]